jgi:hypothetical protein
MKKYIFLFLALLSVYGNAALLDVSGWTQEGPGGSNKKVTITGVASGELFFATGTAGTFQSRVIATTDLPSAIPLSKLATDPLARANHTGTQDWSTITGVPTTLSGLGVTESYQLADPNLDDVVNGDLDFHVTFNQGYTVLGPVVITYQPMVGTSMNLSRRAETYTVSADGISLAFSGIEQDWKTYSLRLTAVGADRSVVVPTSYSVEGDVDVSVINVPQDGSVYVTFIKEPGRWAIVGVPAQTTGANKFVLDTSPTIITPNITGAIGFEDGVTQVFNPNATNAGFAFGPYAGNPTNAIDGSAWYNTLTGKVTSKQNGLIVEWGTGGGGGLASGDIDTAAELAAIMTDEVGSGGGFVRSVSPSFTGTVGFDSLSISGVLTATNLRITPSTTDQTLSTAGDVGFNSTDEQISVHSAADGEISGEASVSLLQHRSFIFDPKAVCDGAVDRLFLMTVGDHAPDGLKIVEWKVSFEADPTTEVDLDLKYADAFIGVANSAVIDVLDTTTGASAEDVNANINGGAAIANGKVMYLEFGTAYTEANHQVIVELWFYAEED